MTVLALRTILVEFTEYEYYAKQGKSAHSILYGITQATNYLLRLTHYIFSNNIFGTIGTIGTF